MKRLKKIKINKVYIIITVLILLIVLPPLFRKLFPDTYVPKVITTITCTRDYPNEKLIETVKIKYINAKINETKISYTPLNNKVTNATTSENELLPSKEIAYFKQIPGATIEEKQTETIITINQNTIDQNPNNTQLKENYFNDQTISQTLYFTNRYFECNETTS